MADNCMNPATSLPDLEGMALFDFILNTHEGTHRRQDPLVFVPYLAGSHKQDKGRLVRVSTDEVVPEIFGGWPPALQQTDDKGLYKASMLLLFNPWRNLQDLKSGHDSFKGAFTVFESVMLNEVRNRIKHIQSYHECGWSGHLGDIGVLLNLQG
jgi:hypothetical protein